MFGWATIKPHSTFSTAVIHAVDELQSSQTIGSTIQQFKPCHTRLPVWAHHRVVQISKEPGFVRWKETRVQLFQDQMKIRVCVIVMAGVVTENKRTVFRLHRSDGVTCRYTRQSCIYPWTGRGPRGRRILLWSGPGPVSGSCYSHNNLVDGTLWKHWSLLLAATTDGEVEEFTNRLHVHAYSMSHDICKTANDNHHKLHSMIIRE